MEYIILKIILKSEFILIQFLKLNGKMRFILP